MKRSEAMAKINKLKEQNKEMLELLEEINQSWVNHNPADLELSILKYGYLIEKIEQEEDK